MTDDARPNPEDLLAAINREETQEKRGRLKIFLGMAAGVGKTFAMLESAQRVLKEGVNVVVGVVNTHGRQDTAAMLAGLKIIPEKEVVYKGTTFKELDIDAILAFKPQLVLIDELAHTNVPGSRHPKRWQDVSELLEKQIDVFTTLNVQHIESMKDIVESITGVTIRETVPDSIIETATYIELIDLTPNELLQRLKEGKVYLGDQSRLASANFFKEDRLTALRELALRYAAEKVDHDLQGMVSMVERADAWKNRERLLVAVSHSPHSQKLLRTTRRIAFNLGAPWYAVHVNTGVALDNQQALQLTKNLQIARDLGAEVVTINDPDLAAAIQRVASQKGVTQIIVGRPPKASGISGFFQRYELLDRLARECINIDVHVIRQENPDTEYQQTLQYASDKQGTSGYLLSAVFVSILAVVNWLLEPYIGYQVVGATFLLGILFLTLFFRKGPTLFSAILFALIWDFFFIPPIGELSIASPQDMALLGLYFVTAVVGGILADRSKTHRQMLYKSEETAQALFEIVRDIANAPNSRLLLESVEERLGLTLDGVCEILAKTSNDELSFEDAPNIKDNEKERTAAIWVFKNGKEAGWSTSTLPLEQFLYVPLKGFSDVAGVLAFKPNNPSKLFGVDEMNFLHTVCQQLANHLEKFSAEERQRHVEALHQMDKIHKGVLTLLSNEFIGPLEQIQKSVEKLEQIQANPPLGFQVPIKQIRTSCEHLSRLLANVSAMEQLSEGMVPLKREVQDIREVIRTCCDNVRKWRGRDNIKVSIWDVPTRMSFDPSLIEMLIYNLLFNAIEYSPDNTPVEVTVKTENDQMVLSVTDQGPGIPEEQLGTIFEKFYRVPGTSAPGIGLGLAVAKTIAEIHDGRLVAENVPSGGARFTLYLPIHASPN